MSSETPTFAPESQPILRLGAYGGRLSPDFAFLYELPYLVIYEDGLFLRLVYQSEGFLTTWKQGRLSHADLVLLRKQIDDLGFWTWDQKEMQKVIYDKPLITDLANNVIYLRCGDQSRTFGLYGLPQYYEHHKLEILAKPARAFDLLEALSPTETAYPKEIEVLVIPEKKCFGPLPKGSEPWPLASFPTEAVGQAKNSGARLTIQGSEVRPLVDAASRHPCLTHEGVRYLVRYRPKLDGAK